MADFFPTLPPLPAHQPSTPQRNNRMLVVSIIGIVVVLFGGAAAAAYMKNWWPFQTSESTSNANGNVNMNTATSAGTVDNTPLALLAQVQQAHFAVQYTGTDPLGAGVESEGDMTTEGDYQFTTGIVKLPKEHMTNDPRDTTEGGLGLMTMGNIVVRVGDHEYHRMNLQALVDANILPEETLTGPNADELSAWEEGTQDKIQFFPNELYYLLNFSKLAKTFTKVDDHTWTGVVEAEVAKAAVWQIERWKGDHTHWRFTSEAEKQQEFADWSPPDITTYPTFTVTTTATGALEKVVFKNLFFADTTTTFSRFDVPVTISLPEAANNPDVDVFHLNNLRVEAAGFIARALVAAYAGKSFPQTSAVIRLDDTTNTIVKTILNDLATVTTTYSPYTTRELEKEFWLGKLVDPNPNTFYYGYSSSDGKSFRLTFIQQAGGNTSSYCNNEKADCVATIRYPEDVDVQ